MAARSYGGPEPFSYKMYCIVAWAWFTLISSVYVYYQIICISVFINLYVVLYSVYCLKLWWLCKQYQPVYYMQCWLLSQFSNCVH